MPRVTVGGFSAVARLSVECGAAAQRVGEVYELSVLSGTASVRIPAVRAAVRVCAVRLPTVCPPRVQ